MLLEVKQVAMTIDWAVRSVFFDEYFENLIGWIDFKNLNPIYPGFIKYLDTSLYFMNEGECLVQFQIPFKHKKYE